MIPTVNSIRRSAKPWLAASVLAACLAAAACSSSGGSGGSATTGSDSGTGATASAASLAQASALVRKYTAAPTTISQTVPLPEKPPAGKSFVFISDNSISGQATIAKGVQPAAEAAGLNYTNLTFSQANPATLQSALQAALLKHPALVATAGEDGSVFGASILAKYKSAGVPILLTTAVPAISGPLILGDPGGPTYYSNSGRVDADWFVSDSKGTGKVLLADFPGLPVLNAWATGFQAEVKSLCPGCVVKPVNMSVAQAESGATTSVMVSALRSNPSYKYVMFSDGSFASGFPSAMAGAGIKGVKIGGSDMQPEQAADLRAGTGSAWTGYNLQQVGYGIVDAALRYFEHAPGSENDDSFPLQILTPDNIGSITTYSLPADSLAQYEKLWKVPVSQ